MAAADRVRKCKERATKFAAKGKYEEALEEYERAVKIAPRDLSVRQKLAETYARLGRRPEAVREYQAVAGSYAADGLLLKAIAICKVLLGIDPNHTETQEILANLYAQRRGGIAEVSLPKNMSGAVSARSADSIRGRPANQIPVNRKEDGEGIISVEDAGAEVIDAPIEIDIDIVEPIEAAELPAEELGGVSGQVQEIAAEAFELDAFEMDFGADLSAPEEDIVEIDEATVDVQALPPIPLFSDLNHDAFVTLTERMELLTAETGELLIAEGEYAASMYIIIQGKVRVVREGDDGGEVRLAELTDGAFFGEMALLSDAPRTASVIAEDDTMLFEISRSLMDKMVASYPSVDSVLKRFHKNRLLTNLLKTSPLFEPFGVRDKKSLIEKFKSRHVDAGKVLITKERAGNALFVLLSGRCEVLSDDDDGRPVVIAELKDGDVFGEMSLLFRQSTSATVRTLTPCIVLRLARQQFDELIMTHPQVLETLSRISEQRENYNKDLLASGPLPSDIIL